MKKIASIFLLISLMLTTIITPLSTNAAENWLWPIDSYYNISSGYGQRSSGWHKGIDIDSIGPGNILGKPVRAARSGYATVFHNSGDSGNYVSINHGDGYVSRYLHLDSIAIGNGNVQRGQVIGYAGNTGNSTGPHLHFDIKLNGNEVNPMPVNYNSRHSYTGSSAPFSESIRYDYSISTPTPSPSPSGKPGGISNTNTTLRWKELNSTYNETTKELQECLNYIMNAGLTVNGYYNLNTHNAVVAFQRQYGLTVDGDAGPKTLNKVNEVLGGYTAPTQNKDTEPPKIENVKITDDDETGYTVTCTVTDNVGIDRVQFPTWTIYNDQDDLVSDWQTNPKARGETNGNKVTFRVNSDEHNRESGQYVTDIYAYDTSGNVSTSRIGAYLNKFENQKIASYKSNDGSEYILFDDIITWEKAKEICESYENGHLATITSEAEQNIIANLVKKGSRKGYFLGATDLSSEGNYKWITGESWTYDNWCPGEPNNDSNTEHYLEFYATGEWNDNSNFEENAGFILEIDPPEHEHLYKSTYESEHPHKLIRFCLYCEYEEYTGKTKKNEECEKCYPHEHSYVIDYEDTHPHKQYKLCEDCGEKQYTGATDKVKSCEECYPHQHNFKQEINHEHPHETILICAECGHSEKTNETTIVNECEICNPPIAKKTVKLQIGVPYMSVDGTEQEIDPGRGTTPILQNQRTLLPIRMIMESFGAFVLWDETENKVTIYAGNTVMQFWINSKTATVNGVPQSMDVAPILVNGRTFMPLRFIAENLGLSVGWNDANQTITITGSL